MRAILVCVDYADILALTMPYNLHHFSSVLVVTSVADVATKELTKAIGVDLFVTDSFYSNGAVFNKWLALEEGLDYLGRNGLLCIMDADVLWPKTIPAFDYQVGSLYTPRRRVLKTVDQTLDVDTIVWSDVPLYNDVEFAGYSQIFYAEDATLGEAPWHQVDWAHAGGADSFFQNKWGANHRIRPPFDVIHLGDPGKNWCGRSTPYLDGTIHPEAALRMEQLKTFRRNRTHGPDRFKHERIP